jgi:hypothetical protein
VRTLYTHADDGRELRLQTGTEPDEPHARISVDAPGERAVSHDLETRVEALEFYSALAELALPPTTEDAP